MSCYRAINPVIREWPSRRDKDHAQQVPVPAGRGYPCSMQTPIRAAQHSCARGTYEFDHMLWILHHVVGESVIVTVLEAHRQKGARSLPGHDVEWSVLVGDVGNVEHELQE